MHRHFVPELAPDQLTSSLAWLVPGVQGIKMGDAQMTIAAFMSAGLFFVISSAKPMPTLSAERPHPNIFCAYVFLSILGQFAMHTFFLVFCYNSALALMPKVPGAPACETEVSLQMPGHTSLSSTTCLSSAASCHFILSVQHKLHMLHMMPYFLRFVEAMHAICKPPMWSTVAQACHLWHVRKWKAGRLKHEWSSQEDAQEPDGDFTPNLVNTVCWLISFVVQLCTFAVNYQGEPFNIPLRLNKPLAFAIQWGSVLFVVLAVDLVPGLAGWFSLVRGPVRLWAMYCMYSCAQMHLASQWLWLPLVQLLCMAQAARKCVLGHVLDKRVCL